MLPDGDLLKIDFPSWKPERIDDYPDALLLSLGNPEIAVYTKIGDTLWNFPIRMRQKNVIRFFVDEKSDKGVIITAPGKEVDFVSRFFAPHCRKLMKIRLRVPPFSIDSLSGVISWEKINDGSPIIEKRRRNLYCEKQKGERVIMGGECVFYMKGEN